jgi:hypothetical protein
MKGTVTVSLALEQTNFVGLSRLDVSDGTPNRSCIAAGRADEDNFD